MRNKSLTTQAKEQLFKENMDILEVLYHLGGGIMLKEHLISLTKYFYPIKNNLKNKINELIECGFLKEQQFITSNKYFVYMTKYPIAKLQGIQSRNANKITPSYEKMANSLFKIEYLLTVTLPKLLDREVTINYVKEIHHNFCHTTFISKSNPELAYRSFRYAIKQEGINLTKDFNYDFATVLYEKEVLISRISNKEFLPNQKYKEMKERNEQAKALITRNKQLINFFNFKNLLSRNFIINGITYNNKKVSIKLTLFDLNNSLEVIYLHKNLGYIYNMFNRYLDLPYGVKLVLNLDVYTWSLDQLNSLKWESIQKAREFGTGGFKKYNKSTYGLIEGGVKEEYLKNIKVEFKTFYLDKRYSLKK